MWYAYIGMALAWWAAVYPLDPFFRSFAWLSLGAVIVLWALAIIYTIKKLPAASADSALAAAPAQ